MTQAQEDAMKKGMEILSEHFDGVLIIAKYLNEQETAESIRVQYHGGFFETMGLVEAGRQHMRRKLDQANSDF